MARTRSLPTGRRESILERVAADGEARVVDLANDLGVSAITVRRDIAGLASDGLLRQVRGGAQKLPEGRSTARVSSTSGGARPPGSTTTVRDVAVVIPSLRYYWPTVLSGASEAADDAGIHVHIDAAGESAEENLQAIGRLQRARTADALIVAPDLRSGEISEELVTRIRDLEMPTVLIERDLRHLDPTLAPLDSVLTDHRHGALAAVAHLHELGHRRIGLLRDPGTPTVPRVVAGWHEAIDAFGIPEKDTVLGTIDTHGDDPAAEAHDFLDLCQERDIHAIHVHSDEAALLVLQEAHQRGLRIPEQLSVTAHDDVLATLSRPPMTAVAPPRHTVGVRAVRALLRRIHSPDAPIEHTFLLPTLNVRGSSAPPP